MYRREFVALPAAGVALVLGLDETPVTGRLSLTDVDRIKERIGRLAAHFTAVGGELYPVAAGYLTRLRRTADHCTYGPRAENALYEAVSDLSSSTAWAALDAGHRGEARLLFADALQSAILAGDGRGQARAWSNVALQLRTEGRLRESLRVTRAALDTRQARHDPLIAALLHARHAITYAQVADGRAVARELLAAEQAYDRADSAPRPSWLRFLTPAELSGLAAIAHRDLGHLADAELATAQALDLLAPSMRRSRSYYRVQLAELQLAQGDLDRAAVTAASVDAAPGSRTITERLAAVHRTLATT
ncbi:hypothetical protein [Streptomyces acidiscabies]|uniref:hypothetical protein n=1 Tax=Streptomyces acidiscabies TaxID=42234 RepID=UPI000E678BB3